MDHLPKASSEFTHLEISFLFDEACPFNYDNQIWTEYPSRAGWDLEPFFDGNFTNRGRNTTDQAASFLQAWLYFGMLHCVTGIAVDTSDFIRTNDQGIQTVSMRNLPHYISRWKRAVVEWPKEEELARTHASESSIETLTNTLVQHLAWETPLSDTIILSITILHRTLMYAKRSILAQSDFEPILNYFQGSRDIIDRHLYNRGWCRRDVARHHQGQSCLAMYFAISLGQRLVPWDHSNCLNTECLALQVDENTYVTQHTRSSCNCSHVGVDVSQVCSLMNGGVTPILKVSLSEGTEEPRLDVLANCEYVCISHVWANGFGNPHANSLPLCQLIRLQSQVNDLFKRGFGDDNVPFWIDTLCIPVQPEHAATRKLGMVAMGGIYKKAAKVLVVDVDLLKSTIAKASDEEIALRISYSVWWSRLWTLQEGVFAKELHFQFQDRALNGRELIERSDKAQQMFPVSGWTASGQIGYEGLAYLRELYTFKSEAATSRTAFILQAVNWRSTSRPSDETICLATLLDLNVQEILSTPKADRLQRFILMQRFFPSISLFFSGAKMDVDGFRWAPKTFVFSRAGLLPAYQKKPDRGGSRFERQTSLAEANESGLHVQFPGFRLVGSLESCSRIGDRILFQDDSNEIWYTFRMMDKTVMKPFINVDPRNIPNLGIVLPRTPTEGNSIYYGILVSVYRDEGGVSFSRLVARASVDQWGVQDLSGIRILLGIGEPNPARGTSLCKDQRWCIG